MTPVLHTKDLSKPATLNILTFLTHFTTGFVVQGSLSRSPEHARPATWRRRQVPNPTPLPVAENNLGWRTYDLLFQGKKSQCLEDFVPTKSLPEPRGAPTPGGSHGPVNG